MKKRALFILFIVCFTSYGQTPNTKKQNTKTMDLSRITNPSVKNAIEALQAGDQDWYSFFIAHPVMTDDGTK